MARIRSVKPSLRTSRVVRQWPWRTRYFWVLLWGYLDDKGRGHDIPKSIAGDCFPLDDEVTPAAVDKMLTVMAATKIEPDRDPPLCRYEVGGVRYLHSVYWDDSQKPNRPSLSLIPPCPTHESFSESDSEPALSRQVLEEEVGGGEGGGGRLTEPATEPPPRQCPKHLGQTNGPNCLACRDARLASEAWQAAKRSRVASSAPCPKHRGQPAHNCGACRGDTLAAEAAARRAKSA